MKIIFRLYKQSQHQLNLNKNNRICLFRIQNEYKFNLGGVKLKKKIICVLLILFMLTAMSACGEPDPEPWEVFIGKWEVESYEMKDEVFTYEHPEWDIDGEIVFYDEEDISIELKATRDDDDEKGIDLFMDGIITTGNWEVLDNGDIEVTFAGHFITTLKFEDERISLTTQNGKFILAKISDNPN